MSVREEVSDGVVLDASALLAWLHDEPGSLEVEGVIRHARVGAANWSEVLQKLWHADRDAESIGRDLVEGGVRVVPTTAADATVAARMWREAPTLSLADRLCLALARRLDATAWTADHGWEGRVAEVRIHTIR